MKEAVPYPEKLSQAISELGKKASRKVLCAFVKSASKCVVRDMLLAAAKLNPGRITQALQAESQVEPWPVNEQLSRSVHR